MPIKNVVFDLGNVLINIDSKRALASFGKPPGEAGAIVRFIFDEHLDKRFDSGQLSNSEFTKLLNDKFSLELSEKQFIDMWNLLLAGEIPGARNCYQYASERYNSAILSNISEIHFKYCQEHYSWIFNGNPFIASFETGAVKPQDKIFRVLFEKTSFCPEDSLFIDDIQENLDAAEKFGMKTLLFKSHEEVMKIISCV